MIPTISRGDVRAAIERLRVEGVEGRRASAKYCLVVDGRHYPPKATVSLAVRLARGRTLLPHRFSGGSETNGVLRRLGFRTVECSCGGISAVESRGATIGRIVVRGRTPDSLASVERLLLHAFRDCWPKGGRVTFLITPGGFARTEWPEEWSGRAGWASRPSDVDRVRETAERAARRVVTSRVLDAARGKASVLTIGVDLHSNSIDEHTEMVAVFDVARREIVRWTGKSYPVAWQERTLLQVVDLSSHLLRIARERVLVLGCHDLNMFSPRGAATQTRGGPRWRRCRAMQSLVRGFRPTVVLQHPHSTDTPNIWRMPWRSLARRVPSIRAWASGIGYYNGWERVRAPLSRVLALTQGGEPCIDVVVNARKDV